ncbi:hypothetical protein HanLR1_Chr03g0078591 [Helianthus annuus]|nr:hypothetical protein HanHA89_Chr03g0085071 [Helianthus annuus]KAJ0766526.1 hypothetical protein HanLR1_Chr03g0078591 [Helianthus annuus]
MWRMVERREWRLERLWRGRWRSSGSGSTAVVAAVERSMGTVAISESRRCRWVS